MPWMLSVVREESESEFITITLKILKKNKSKEGDSVRSTIIM